MGEVHTNLWEMLDSGTIWPNQCPWFNTAVLVQKKDGSLHFCIDFYLLMPAQRRIHIHCQGSKRHLKVWSVCRSFLMPGPEVWTLVDEDGWSCWSSTPHLLSAILGFFECDCMPFGLCNIPATFQRLMQKCLREAESNVLPHLPWWHNCIFSQMIRGTPPLHFHIICDQFREHNLNLKPSKHNFFKNEIIYLAHWVSKDRVHPSNSNLKAIAECAPMPQTCTEVWAFLSLMGHYRRFIKGFACIAQPLSEYLMWRGGWQEVRVGCSLTKDAMKAFEALKQACMTAPILVFADYTKPFLLETDASKDGLGAVLSQKQTDGWYHPVAYGSRALMPHEKNYHSTKLEFLALKWAVTEHFKEYLPYQSFVVWTDNNPLTYIMSMPNLDATCHQWVGALMQFNFKLEYQKGHDNAVANVLSQVTTRLDSETVKSILNGVALGTVCTRLKSMTQPWWKVTNAWSKKYEVAAGHPLVEMHVTNWAEAQREDPMWSALCWTGWRHRSRQIWKCSWKNMPPAKKVNWSYGINRISQFTREPCTYAQCPKGKTEDLLLFVVPKVHLCHHTEWVPLRCRPSRAWTCMLSLLWEHFWQPGMTNQL